MEPRPLDYNFPGDSAWGDYVISDGDFISPYEPYRSIFDKIKIEGLLGDTGLPIELDFLDDDGASTLKVVYGLNGSGKTTLLRLIEAIIDKNIAKILSIPFKKIEIIRRERFSERYDYHQVIRKGLVLWTYDPSNTTNFLRIFPWTESPNQIGYNQHVEKGDDIDTTEIRFDMPSLSKEETLKVREWAKSNPGIVTWDAGWSTCSEEELFTGGIPLEIEVPDRIHRLSIHKDHLGRVNFSYDINADLMSDDPKDYEELFDILDIDYDSKQRFYGNMKIISKVSDWDEPISRYVAMCYELGHKKAVSIESEIRLANKDKMDNLWTKNLLFSVVKSDPLAVFTEKSLQELISQGLYDIDGVEKVFLSYLGYSELSPYVHEHSLKNDSIIKNPISYGDNNEEGWRHRSFSKPIKTSKISINSDLDNNREELLSSITKLVKRYSNTIQVMYNDIFFNYRSDIYNMPFIRKRFPNHVIKVIDNHDSNISENMKRAIWRSVGQSIVFYHENIELFSDEEKREINSYLILFRDKISALLYGKNIDRKSISRSWARKWKHPSTAIGYRALRTLLGHENMKGQLKERRIRKQAKQFLVDYNYTFGAIEILNQLIENKEFYLDGNLNLCVSDNLEFSDLSHGELRLLNIILSIQMQLWRSKDRGESVIILIDEPELGLHLKWQSKLMDAIGNLLRVNSSDLLRCRILLASHSPEIVGSYPQFSTSLRAEGVE